MIDGQQISEADFADLAAQDASVMQQALQGTFGSLTHFEVLTSLAFRHFQRKQVQHATQPPSVIGSVSLHIVAIWAEASVQRWQVFAFPATQLSSIWLQSYSFSC